MRSFSLIGVGAIAGLAVSLGISAYAFRDTRSPIPSRNSPVTDVFGAIRPTTSNPLTTRN